MDFRVAALRHDQNRNVEGHLGVDTDKRLIDM
jgi:hypothetical protein